MSVRVAIKIVNTDVYAANRMKVEFGKDFSQSTDNCHPDPRVGPQTWNEEIEALTMTPKDKVTFKLYSGEQQVGRKSCTLSKFYSKQAMPPGPRSDFIYKLSIGHGHVYLQLAIDWPVDLAMLWPSDKQRWVDGKIVKTLTPEELNARFIVLAQKLKKKGCHDVFIEKLRWLEGWDFVLICDDSGSMSTPTEYPNTRWSELKDNAKHVMKLCTALDPDGISVHFLNRKGAKNITDGRQVHDLFVRGPSGGTPLGEALERAMEEKTIGKPMVIILATDGVPNSQAKLIQALRSRQIDPQTGDVNPRLQDTFVTFLACSNVESEVGWMNKIDVEEINVDVLDDYQSELKEVAAAQGWDHATALQWYTKGDHRARMLVGPVFAEFDKIDEKGFRYY